MDKNQLVDIWKQQLHDVFALVKAGQPDDKKKYRAEGFLHALRLSGVVSDREVNDIIEQTHQDVFGESVAERQARKATLNTLKENDPDAYFNIPAVERRGQ